jgi:hypothetical protein
MNEKPSYDAIDAARRVRIDDTANAAMQAEIDMQLWDMRLAAVLNTMAIAMYHGKIRDWTMEHSRQIRAMMAIVDETIVAGDSGTMPSGFGPVVRTAQAARIVNLAGKASALSLAEESGA